MEKIAVSFGKTGYHIRGYLHIIDLQNMQIIRVTACLSAYNMLYLCAERGESDA